MHGLLFGNIHFVADNILKLDNAISDILIKSQP